MRSYILYFSGLLSLVLVIYISLETRPKPETQTKPEELVSPTITTPKPPPKKDEDSLVTSETSIKKNKTLLSTLYRAGLSKQEVFAMLRSAKDQFNPRRLAANTKIIVHKWQKKNSPYKVDIYADMLTTYSFTYQKNLWKFEKLTTPTTVHLRRAQGQIHQSLWQSALDSGLTPDLIDRLAQIFAWQIDFEREPRKGDSWQLVLEEELVDGKHLRWGKIHLAHYKLRQKDYWAIRHQDPDDSGADYYDLQGLSVRGLFLKSPLKFSRISSRFQRRRFHPILGINRPHLGVDYAARRGTPVMAVGDGKVIIAGTRGGSGKMIKIRHNKTYQTAYKHLSRYGAGIRRGVYVKQGQLIGYVGSTGLATGPHLHFEFWERGRFIDPLGKRFPREKKLPRSKMNSLRLSFARYATFMQNPLF